MRLLETFKNSEDLLRSNGFIPPGLIAAVPEERKLIILVDIVGFSKFPTRKQLYTIYILQHYLLKKVLDNKIHIFNNIRISEFIPTGDGCYIVADECDTKMALDFLITLVGGFQYVKTDDGTELAMRASAIIGNCVPFLDMSKRKNYIGEGMCEASRVLSCGQSVLENEFKQKNPDAKEFDIKNFSKNTLFLDSTLSVDLESYSDDYTKLYEYKNVADKHGKTRNIWCLQGLA